MLQAPQLDSPNAAGSPEPDWALAAAGALDAARELARALADSAPERDRRGGDPIAEMQQLRRSGLLGFAQRYRLAGATPDWATALQAVRIVARGDCSMAHLLGYHYAIGETLWLLGTEQQASALAREAVERDLYWAAIDNPLDPDLVLRPSAGGFVLSGRKTFATGARLADRVIVAGRLDGVAITAAVPADRDGLLANDDWDNIGQRATASGSVELRELHVAPEEILGPFPPPREEPSPQAALVAPLTQIVLVNAFLGAAEGALQDALRYTRTTTRPWRTSGVSAAVEDPYILERYGELTAELRASRALAEQAAALLQGAVDAGGGLDAQTRGEAAIAIYAAKVHSSRVALELTSRVFELMGARATARRYAFDRRWRDVRTLTLHDPAAYKAREVGEYVLTGALPPFSPYS